MSRSAAPPNAGRAVPVPPIYYAVLAELERVRQQFGIPMWKLDDAAGAQSRYFSKALHADTPTGRMATWTTLQMFVETLFPEGFSLSIKAKPGALMPASTHRLSIAFSGARYDLEARKDWMTELSKKGASKGGKARWRGVSRRKRTAIARKAAKKRWSTPKVEEVAG